TATTTPTIIHPNRPMTISFLFEFYLLGVPLPPEPLLLVVCSVVSPSCVVQVNVPPRAKNVKTSSRIRFRSFMSDLQNTDPFTRLAPRLILAAHQQCIGARQSEHVRRTLPA